MRQKFKIYILFYCLITRIFIIASTKKTAKHRQFRSEWLFCRQFISVFNKSVRTVCQSVQQFYSSVWTVNLPISVLIIYSSVGMVCQSVQIIYSSIQMVSQCFVDRSLTVHYPCIFPIRTVFRFAFHGHIYLYAPANNIVCLFQNTLSETKFQASLSLSYGSPPWLLGLIVWLVLRYSVACMRAWERNGFLSHRYILV